MGSGMGLKISGPALLHATAKLPAPPAATAGFAFASSRVSELGRKSPPSGVPGAVEEGRRWMSWSSPCQTTSAVPSGPAAASGLGRGHGGSQRRELEGIAEGRAGGVEPADPEPALREVR